VRTSELMAHFALLGRVNDALEVLEGAELIDYAERMRLTRKYMDDRPEFKEAAQASITGASA
jgi:hypothetical protein